MDYLKVYYSDNNQARIFPYRNRKLCFLSYSEKEFIDFCEINEFPIRNERKTIFVKFNNSKSFFDKYKNN